MSAEQDISVKQQNILELLAECDSNQRFAPTMREIMDALDLSSTSEASHHLRSLAKKGMITREPLLARSSQITQKGYEAIRPGPGQQKV